MSKNAPVLAACALALAGIVIFGLWLDWDGVVMAVSADKLVGLLSPIAFAAAVVERGVEILISPWRDAGAAKLEKELAAVKARPASLLTAETDAADLKTVSDELDEYRGTTQRYAFAVSLVLSILLSIAGVRALGPFLDIMSFDRLKTAHPGQHTFFLCMDVSVTATLLAGGADGVHSVVNAITSFFDASADKSSKS